MLGYYNPKLQEGQPLFLHFGENFAKNGMINCWGPLKPNFRSDGEKYCHKFCVKNRRNTGCLSRFLKAKVGAKEPPFRRKGVFRGPRLFSGVGGILRALRPAHPGGAQSLPLWGRWHGVVFHAVTDEVRKRYEFAETQVKT